MLDVIPAVSRYFSVKGLCSALENDEMRTP